jgi:hypothetical protein
MAALQDAIAQIDALITRLQTDPPTNGAHAPASHAASRTPVLAALSTDKHPRGAEGTASTTSAASAATALSVSAATATTTAAAAARSAAGSGPAVTVQLPHQHAAGGAASAAAAPVAAGTPSESVPSAVTVGRAKTASKPAKAPKAAPVEPTPADLFAKAHIQVRSAPSRHEKRGFPRVVCSRSTLEDATAHNLMPQQKRADRVPPSEPSSTRLSVPSCRHFEGNHPGGWPDSSDSHIPSVAAHGSVWNLLPWCFSPDYQHMRATLGAFQPTL